MAEPSDIAPEQNKASPDQPFKKRVAQFDYYYDVRTFTYKLRKSAKQKKSEPGNHRDKYAIMIKRQIDSRGQFRGSVIEIKSARLRDVLIEINEGVEDIELSRSDPEVTAELMYYSYPRLLERLAVEQNQEERDEMLICDIEAGIFYVTEYMGSVMKDVDKMISQCEISFDSVWALFFPNTLAYSHHAGTNQDTVMIIRRSEYKTNRMTESRYLEVICDYIHDDGEDFGLARTTLQIEAYHGTRPITSLRVYPLKYHDDHEGVYTRAVDLGKNMVQMPTHSFREIHGRTSRRVQVVSHEPKPEDSDHNVHPKANSFEKEPIFRVMISPYAYANFNSSIYPSVHHSLNKNKLTDDQYAMCSPVARGYAMDRKAWGEFALTRVRDVNWDDGAFDALVLGQKQKTLIHSLVLQHANNDNDFDDIIKGKGRGLIGLLSGTPGCGKTLTAEAVAEVTHKPLYTLSAGELGITPTSLEATLDKVLELAQMWDAVLLLDEAEVFLTQRNISDLKRNALVSIFLRRLEYYQGILVLTTNMPKDIDYAFQSRIHFSINYPELNFNSRKIIWEMFFKRNCTNISDEELCRLASHSINGRQIKNTFSSALTISRAGDPSEGSVLKNVDIVLGVLNEWDQATRSAPAVDWDADIL